VIQRVPESDPYPITLKEHGAPPSLGPQPAPVRHPPHPC
jgi:hypothetical protein